MADIRVVTTEKKSGTYEFESKSFWGPCMVCGHEIEYGYSGKVSNYGTEWIAKQFEAPRLNQHLKTLHRGDSYNGPVKVETLEVFLCRDCRKACQDSRTLVAEQDRERRRQAEEQHAKDYADWTYRTTWRKAPEDLVRSEGIQRFEAMVRQGKTYAITFRWRLTPKCQCRGDDFGAVVGMWVDGKLAAHYYGWDLTSIEANEATWNYYGPDSPPGRERRDRFAKGFRVWFQRAFQSDLVASTPDRAWSVLGAKVIDFNDLPENYLFHIVWHDGSRYARVGSFETISDAARFARKYLSMKLVTEEWRAVPVD